MVAERSEQEFVTPAEQDVPRLQELHTFLRERAPRAAQLVVPGEEHEERLEIPASLYAVLRQIVLLMARGETIALIPLHKELTTQDAAALLNMSRPSLIKLLDAGAIPYRRQEGGHRRVRFADVMAYKHRRSAARQAAFAEMAAIGQKYGAYEPDADDGVVDRDETTDECT